MHRPIADDIEIHVCIQPPTTERADLERNFFALGIPDGETHILRRCVRRILGLPCGAMDDQPLLLSERSGRNRLEAHFKLNNVIAGNADGTRADRRTVVLRIDVLKAKLLDLGSCE
jgi:hypothetical protein